ncbi:MAG: class I SAM-dependent methyltransferase [Chitinophagaceae bacterium]
MNLSDSATIRSFHHNAIAKYGPGTIDALGWISADSQSARFEALCRMANFYGHNILDIGCGHGDLRSYIGNTCAVFNYTGIEQIPEILEIAVQRHAHLPDTGFIEGDFSEAELPAADYILASGVFNYRSSDPLYVYNMIERLFYHCRLGFAFNLLSRLKYPDDAIAAYNPADITTFCRRLTNKVQVIDGYWEDDFTVLMYH